MAKQQKPQFNPAQVSTKTPTPPKKMEQAPGEAEKPSKRVNVQLTPSEHRQLKIKAAEEGSTISELIRQWVNEYLSK